MKEDILGIPPAGLEARILEAGLPKFRARQVLEWLHRKRAGAFGEMTNLPKDFRARLAELYEIRIPEPERVQVSRDGTRKALLRFADGERVEAVWMRYRHGASVCLSTQAGCRMGCVFCASTLPGLRRNLSAGEILGELYAMEKISGEKAGSIVLMGMGEPLDNFEQVTRFLDVLSDPDGTGMSLRHVSLSTCGLVPEIDRLAECGYPLTLSVSLHAAEDGKRSALMPVNRRYPVGELIAACDRYFERTGRRISYEYALVAGENDSLPDADRLAGLLRGKNCHVNLIPVNEVRGRSSRRPDRETVEATRAGWHGAASTRRSGGNWVRISARRAGSSARRLRQGRTLELLKVTGQTHKGAVRPQNQDFFRHGILGDSLGYAVVCDGMGGEKAGDVASRATTDIVDRYMNRGLSDGMGANSVRSLMLSAVSAANAVVFEQAQLNPDFAGMGTTLALAVVSGGTLHICHVGDSRIYLIDGSESSQLTRDHSMVQMLVDRGEISREEAANHPKKHYITRAVGVSPRVDPDYAEYPFGGRKVLLLCSDGLSNYLRPEMIAEKVRVCVKKNSARPLIDFALERGGADNITAVLLLVAD